MLWKHREGRCERLKQVGESASMAETLVVWRGSRGEREGEEAVGYGTRKRHRRDCAIEMTRNAICGSTCY